MLPNPGITYRQRYKTPIDVSPQERLSQGGTSFTAPSSAGFIGTPLALNSMVAGYWLLLTIHYTLTLAGYIITTTTDQPVHLWLRLTSVPPRIHADPVYKRGLYLHGDPRYCVVSFTDIEQLEPGDTLTHTFVVAPWAGCETKWFYFHGTIAGVPSPSTSALFERHRPYYAELTPHLDGWVGHAVVGPGLSWQDLALSPGNFASTAGATDVSFNTQSDLAGNLWDYLNRAIIIFDTTTLPLNTNLQSVTFELYGADKLDSLNILPNLALVSASPATNNNLVPADYGRLGTRPLAPLVSFADYKVAADPDTWNLFQIPPAELKNAIALTDYTRLGLRDYTYDILTQLEPGLHDPTWQPFVKRSRFRHYTTEQGVGFEPTLKLVWLLY